MDIFIHNSLEICDILKILGWDTLGIGIFYVTHVVNANKFNMNCGVSINHVKHMNNRQSF